MAAGHRSQAVVGMWQPSLFVGGQLHFSGSHGGSVVIGICGQSQRSVVVKSIVDSSDEHGWWW